MHIPLKIPGINQTENARKKFRLEDTFLTRSNWTRVPYQECALRLRNAVVARNYAILCNAVQQRAIWKERAGCVRAERTYRDFPRDITSRHRSFDSCTVARAKPADREIIL